MAIQAVKWAAAQKIGWQMKLVLFSLAGHANPFGRAWISQDMLAQETGMSVRTVQRYLARLQYHRLIRTEKRSAHKRGEVSNTYILAYAD